MVPVFLVALLVILFLTSPLAAGTFYERAPGRLPLCQGQCSARVETIPPLARPPSPPKSLPDLGMAGDRVLTDEADLGIINGLLTTNVTYRDALSLRGLWAPPFASSDFTCEVRLAGERVPTAKWRWEPAAVDRQGAVGPLNISSRLVLPAGQRGALLTFTVRNAGAKAQDVPLQVVLRGTLDRVEQWEFGRPGTSTATTVAAAGRELTLANDAGAIVVAADVPMTWEPWSGHWEGTLHLRAGESQVHHLCLAIGQPPVARQAVREGVTAPRTALVAADRAYLARVRDLYGHLPRLEADDRRLEHYYNRSLVHLITNRWEVPEFRLHPGFTTGSINGGCVCSYLWDYGEPWELLPLLTPAAVREHIKQFLSVDLTSHFAFSPITGAAFGPWYPVNQEKIIRSIYYYVAFTGDTAFLAEQVAGKSVLDWAVFHAGYKDDPAGPVTLVDYGKGNNHLELRRQYRYDNVLPDLNGRRYDNYVAAYLLTELAGRPQPWLLERAEGLKALIREKLWSPADRWLWHLDESGGRQLRYTIQMFKLVGSGVLDAEMEQGLVSHLNEREFLSTWGMHSMSKLDPAFDQVDIDNGGGGSYVSFPPQIAERLYRAGQPDLAADILRRQLWMGERLPYWGDSQVANAMDYRRDTPLQCSIGGAAGAQAVICGMFGVGVTPAGDIVVNPRPPSWSPHIKLTGLQIRGCLLDVAAGPDGYTVTANGKRITAPAGTAVALRTAAK